MSPETKQKKNFKKEIYEHLKSSCGFVRVSFPDRQIASMILNSTTDQANRHSLWWLHYGHQFERQL